VVVSPSTIMMLVDVKTTKVGDGTSTVVEK